MRVSGSNRLGASSVGIAKPTSNTLMMLTVNDLLRAMQDATQSAYER